MFRKSDKKCMFKRNKLRGKKKIVSMMETKINIQK